MQTSTFVDEDSMNEGDSADYCTCTPTLTCKSHVCSVSYGFDYYQCKYILHLL